MFLIVGLGNPGLKYKFTRHNVGFRVVDELHSSLPSLLLRKNSVIDNLAPLTLKGVVLAKPKSFMNLSGQAVKSLVKKYKIPITNLWVIHDDIDLPLGKIRISKGRGAAGHRGVESIIKELGTKNFVRFRLGICPKADKPPTKNMVRGKPKNPEKFVLQKFTKNEEKIVKQIIKKTAETIEFSLKEGVEKAMSKYNC